MFRFLDPPWVVRYDYGYFHPLVGKANHRNLNRAPSHGPIVSYLSGPLPVDVCNGFASLPCHRVKFSWLRIYARLSGFLWILRKVRSYLLPTTAFTRFLRCYKRISLPQGSSRLRGAPLQSYLTPVIELLQRHPHRFPLM